MLKFLKTSAKTEYGYKASLLDYLGVENISIPARINDEIPTLNQHGFMKQDLDEYSQRFVERTSQVDMSIDIGCTYGFVCKQIIDLGNKVVAFDLEEKHLKVLGASINERKRENLYLMRGDFPKDFQYRDKIFGSVLASRIMHFLRRDDFIIGLNRIHKSLIDGGKFFFTSVTPYHSAIRGGFLKIYEERKARGDEWPGEIENQWKINPKHMKFVHPFLHVFDIEDLKNIVNKYGFRIDSIKLFDYPNDTDSQGKGHVGFEATKV